MNKWNLVLSLAAGLAGSAFFSYVQPLTAHAQSQAPEEIRAQRFTLVNQDGAALGALSFDDSGRPQLVLRDRSGHEVWKLVGEHVERVGSGRFYSK